MKTNSAQSWYLNRTTVEKTTPNLYILRVNYSSRSCCMLYADSTISSLAHKYSGPLWKARNYKLHTHEVYAPNIYVYAWSLAGHRESNDTINTEIARAQIIALIQSVPWNSGRPKQGIPVAQAAFVKRIVGFHFSGHLNTNRQINASWYVS